MKDCPREAQVLQDIAIQVEMSHGVAIQVGLEVPSCAAGSGGSVDQGGAVARSRGVYQASLGDVGVCSGDDSDQ